jgi:hypothetical protein
VRYPTYGKTVGDAELDLRTGLDDRRRHRLHVSYGTIDPHQQGELIGAISLNPAAQDGDLLRKISDHRLVARSRVLTGGGSHHRLGPQEILTALSRSAH